MRIEEFDWSGGRVVFWDLDKISLTLPAEPQIDDLKEDLAQIEYEQNTLLDIGWYPEFSKKGRFVITVVRDQEWDSPVLRLECKDTNGLAMAIRDGIRRAISEFPNDRL